MLNSLRSAADPLHLSASLPVDWLVKTLLTSILLMSTAHAQRLGFQADAPTESALLVAPKLPPRPPTNWRRVRKPSIPSHPSTPQVTRKLARQGAKPSEPSTTLATLPAPQPISVATVVARRPPRQSVATIRSAATINVSLLSRRVSAYNRMLQGVHDRLQKQVHWNLDDLEEVVADVRAARNQHALSELYREALLPPERASIPAATSLEKVIEQLCLRLFEAEVTADLTPLSISARPPQEIRQSIGRLDREVRSWPAH